MRALLTFCLALAGVGLIATAVVLLGTRPSPAYWTWRDACDAAQRERVFLNCLQMAKHMGGVATPGNDSNEVVESCDEAARHTACKQVFTCIERCVDGGTP